MASNVKQFTPQSKSRSYGNISAEQVDTQAKEVERLLREAHARGQGVNRAFFLFELRYTQVGARIDEINKHIAREGLKIRSRKVAGQRYVEYFIGKADQAAFSDSPDWYERRTGRPRVETNTAPEFELVP